MGLLSSILGSAEERMLDYYGIRRPYDAIEVVGRILRNDMDYSDQQKHLRNIIGWLKRLSISNKNGADQAADALKQIKSRWGDDVPV